ncbi:PepSY-associated TM helix domain-containing protein [Acuticoccus mangrovi]|uniref:PepSY domain-containing protein n=1 Tax=Acuticoccus mangrovi TaxID=2796142 RepID=A0A934IL47_9HYPH|nr:PepSY-associated TM helix domain-containing protein [Acuticoccus mangrovi]MBJ3778639.1 PepSY domain-containing protein [Acuticoccus mangrovi]
MSVRRAVFWAHLSVALAAGLVILTMSVTGVLLTYERQIVAFAERQAFTVPASDGARLDADALADAARAALGDDAFLVLTSDGLVKATAGRRATAFLDPTTGAVMGSGVEGVEAFFRGVTAFHRWFALEGEGRAVARAITGAANLAFLFIVISGLVLWWPKRWRWPLVKTHVVFRRGLPTAKARDYNWHHVFGIWASLPLVLVVASGVVFSYPWANGLVFALYGETPTRGRPGPQSRPAPAAHPDASGPTATTGPLDLDGLLDRLREATLDWRTITVPLGAVGAEAVEATVDTGNGAQAGRQRTLTLSRADGSILAERGIEAATPARRARVWLRFIHTGEVYGVLGQTIAGLASLAAVFLVWTGFALAFRRLIRPLIRRPVAASRSG